MSLIIYVYSKCSTCQKALRFLDESKIIYEKREITLTPPSIEELQRMLKFVDNNVNKLFNTSGILYRELNLSKLIPEMPVSKAFELLSTQGMLVKRPFLLGENVGLLGYNDKLYAKLIDKLTVL